MHQKGNTSRARDLCISSKVLCFSFFQVLFSFTLMTTLTDKQFVFESDHFPMFDYMNGLLPGEMVCMYNHSTWGQRQKGW